MFLFKKKIEFHQFIANAVFNSVNSYDSNFDKMVVLADEFNVLTAKDKDKLRDFGYSLIMVDLIISGTVLFNGDITNEELSREIGLIYVKFLNEVKHLNENEIQQKVDDAMKLINATESAEGSENDLKFLLCSKFAELYSGNKFTDEKIRQKNFAVMKLANALVKADILKLMSKENNIVWNSKK